MLIINSKIYRNPSFFHPAAPRPQSPLNGELAAIASDHDYSDLEAKTNAEVVALLAQIRDEQRVI